MSVSDYQIQTGFVQAISALIKAEVDLHARPQGSRDEYQSLRDFITA